MVIMVLLSFFSDDVREDGDDGKSPPVSPSLNVAPAVNLSTGKRETEGLSPAPSQHGNPADTQNGGEKKNVEKDPVAEERREKVKNVRDRNVFCSSTKVCVCVSLIQEVIHSL